MATTTITTCDKCGETTTNRTSLEIVCGELRTRFDRLDLCLGCSRALADFMANRASSSELPLTYEPSPAHA